MNGKCTLTAIVSGVLNVINEVTQAGVGQVADYVHMTVGIVLAIATLIAIWRIDSRRNNGFG
jgi:hypothetical protein